METIEIAEHINTDVFDKTYYRRNKPVVIKGLTDREIAGRSWTLGYFKEKMGDLEIEVYDNKNPQSKSTAHTTGDLKMKLADYISILETDEPTDLRIFLYNFFKTFPELQKEYPCPHLFKGILDQKSYMFFGGKDTTVRIHYDIDVSDILLTHFGGRKKVILFAPRYSRLLYKLPLNTYSLVNLDHPDYEKYPGLKYLQGYECILEQGDTLYIPSGYWHYITYLDKSFSISYRKLAYRHRSKLQGALNLFLRLPLDKALARILGPHWLRIKEKIAHRRADAEIQRLQGSRHETAQPTKKTG